MRVKWETLRRLSRERSVACISTGVYGDSTWIQGNRSNTRSPQWRGGGNSRLATREGMAGLPWVADRFVVPLKPGNSGGGKGPEF